MSGNVKFDKWVNDDNSENYKCRAWVNFNGQGTVAIRASGGVSSITDNGVGLFVINFSTAMLDNRYAVSAINSVIATPSDAYNATITTGSTTNSQYGIYTAAAVAINVRDITQNRMQDPSDVSAAIFR